MATAGGLRPEAVEILSDVVHASKEIVTSFSNASVKDLREAIQEVLLKRTEPEDQHE